ncbi:GNAT family N-acetyltransferase [Sporosarcina sp. USHLN248]|uniref:GNAT family N-acetyltransferase n=1 Tax=Sporosarcina sp. USHLN248 TaxID=3081300 RepID=UPI0038B4890D
MFILAVKPSCKGKGIATKLMKYGECKLSEMEEKRVRLTVAKTHPYLSKMYGEKGYEIVGERFFQDLPYDEFIMEKLL